MTNDHGITASLISVKLDDGEQKQNKSGFLFLDSLPQMLSFLMKESLAEPTIIKCERRLDRRYEKKIVKNYNINLYQICKYIALLKLLS